MDYPIHIDISSVLYWFGIAIVAMIAFFSFVFFCGHGEAGNVSESLSCLAITVPTTTWLLWHFGFITFGW